ncbi:MAG: hypothetical protein GX133_12115, partial [Syntrophomonadaceae bacterium]|nr:hypothetical protein [Syntrophomonadaceae bacterium]
MALSFQDFIRDKISPDLVSGWADTNIEKVDVDRDKQTWLLHLGVQEPIANSVCRATEKQLRQYFDYLQAIELVPALFDSYDSLPELIESRRRDIAATVFADGENLFQSSALTWNCKNTRIDLVCKSPEIYENIIGQGICTRIAAWFWDEYCLQILVRAILVRQGEQKHRTRQHYLAEGKLEVIQPLKQSIRTGQRGGYNRDQNKLLETIREKSVPIADIEEGMKTAIAQGEVWDKKIVPMQEGQIAA